MTEIYIRTATPDDLAVMASLWLEKITLVQQSDSYFSVLPDGMLRWQETVAGWLTQTDYAVFVAEKENTLIGCIIGKLQDSPPGLTPTRYGAVLDIILDMHTYHGGLGSALVNALWAWFRQFDIDRVSLRVSRSFAVEQAFWRALGVVQPRDEMWITL